MRPAAADVADLVRRVGAAPPRLGAVRLVVVDGPAGSGKTTLAGLLAAALDDAPVVHMDDLYEGWTGLGRDVWARLREQVLDPLARGHAARYQRFDWDQDRFDDWVDVPRHDVLVVEGVGAAAAPVDQLSSLRVWVEVDRDLRLDRGLARDGARMSAHWLSWSALEDAHFAEDGTRGRADVVIDGTLPASR